MTEVKIEIKKSKVFKELESGMFTKRVMSQIGDEVLLQWNEKASSSRYWRLGSHDKRIPKPVTDKLTEREGRLIEAVRNPHSSESKQNKKITDTDMTLTRILTVPYANRQERQQGNRRSYMQRSLELVLSKIDSIKNKVLRKMREEMKNG